MGPDKSCVTVDNISVLISIVPASPLLYMAVAILVPILVRAGISLVETKRLRIHNGFCLIFMGVGGNDQGDKKVPSDYWLPFILGVVEMLAYPLLIVSNQPLFIGFWLVFKTVHRWSYAQDYKRGPYNRYLVANAAILIGAYSSARWTVAP